jgi:hypothetical protein
VLHDKAPDATGEHSIENAIASAVATARLAQETRRQIRASRRLRVQCQAPMSIADLLTQPHARAAKRKGCR